MHIAHLRQKKKNLFWVKSIYDVSASALYFHLKVAVLPLSPVISAPNQQHIPSYLLAEDWLQ